MNPRECCSYYCGEREIKKQYQLVIMTDEGRTYCAGKLYDWNEIQEAVKEMRELYYKHGITYHVGYREV